MRSDRVLPSVAVVGLLVALLLVPNRSAADPPQNLWEELNSPRVGFNGSATGTYDPVQHRMVVIIPGNGRNEVWAYDFDPPAQWKHLLPYASGSSISADPSWKMAYDALHSRIGTSWNVLLTTNDPVQWQVLSTTPFGSDGMVYDPFVDRLVSYDGNGTVRTLLLHGSMNWTTLATSGSPPPNRSGSSAIFDTDHRRMIVFGGSLRNDVWALSLTGTPTWTQIFPGGSPPPTPRGGHVAVYNSRHRSMIMAGGDSGAPDKLSDVYELFLTPGSEVWSGPINTTVANRYPFAFAAAGYDSLNDQLIVYPGRGYQTSLMQTLSMSGDPYTWTTRSPQEIEVPQFPNPGPQAQTPCVYDTLRHQLVTYLAQQLWCLPLTGVSEWQKLATATLGPSLGAAAMIYDPVNDRLVTFGGWDTGVPNGYSNAIHTLTLAPPRTWGTITPSGSPPVPRYGPAGVYDSMNQRLVVFGGRGQFAFQNDAYGISLTGPADWTPLPAAGPPSARAASLAVYDRVRHRMVLHGGYDNQQTYDDTWSLPLDGSPLNWAHVLPSGSPPRVQGVPVDYDPVRDRMVVLSDYSLADALTFSGTPTWNSLATYGAQPGGNFQDKGGIYDPNGDRMVALHNSGNPWSLRFRVREQLDVLPGESDRVSGLAIAALHPNPTFGPFALELSLPSAAPAVAEVYDLHGRRVLRQAVVPSGAGRQRVTIDLRTGLDAGVYFVRVAQDGSTATARVAIVH